MKRLIWSVLMLSIGTMAIGQVEVRQSEVRMSKGTQPAFIMNLTTRMDDDDLEDMWDDYLDDADADDVDSKDGEIFGDNLTVEAISANTIDVYSRITGKKNNFTLTVWFDLGGAYLTSARHPEGTAAARQWLQQFALQVEASGIKEDLEEEEDRLKDMEDDVEDLEDDIKSLEKDIRKYEERVAEAKEKLLEKQKQLVDRQRTFDAQKAKVEQVKKTLKKIN
jgi:hypothetical protein